MYRPLAQGNSVTALVVWDSPPGSIVDVYTISVSQDGQEIPNVSFTYRFILCTLILNVCFLYVPYILCFKIYYAFNNFRYTNLQATRHSTQYSQEILKMLYPTPWEQVQHTLFRYYTITCYSVVRLHDMYRPNTGLNSI